MSELIIRKMREVFPAAMSAKLQQSPQALSDFIERQSKVIQHSATNRAVTLKETPELALQATLESFQIDSYPVAESALETLDDYLKGYYFGE